jgi:hypothetical protein
MPLKLIPCCNIQIIDLPDFRSGLIMGFSFFNSLEIGAIIGVQTDTLILYPQNYKKQENPALYDG